MSYQGNYVSAVPVWNPDPLNTVEPSETKRNSGWDPGEKPPAQWFNYLHQRYYESLKELDNALKIVDDAQDNHLADMANPHKTTSAKVDYSNIDSSLVATTVKGAIDELDSKKLNIAGGTMAGDLVFENDQGIVGKDTYDNNRNLLKLRSDNIVSVGNQSSGLVLEGANTPTYYDGNNTYNLWHKGNDDLFFYRDGSKAITGHIDFANRNIQNLGRLNFRDIGEDNKYFQIYEHPDSASLLFTQREVGTGNWIRTPLQIKPNGTVEVNQSRVLTTNDEGKLDAGTLDGVDSSQFLRSDTGGTITGTTSIIDAGNPALEIKSTNGGQPFIDFASQSDVDFGARIMLTTPDTLNINGAELMNEGKRVLTTADEGSGNGLNADLLDGQHLSDLDSRYLNVDGDTITGDLIHSPKSYVKFRERVSRYATGIRFLDGNDQEVTGITKNSNDEIIIGEGVVTNNHSQEMQIAKDGSYIKFNNGADRYLTTQDEGTLNAGKLDGHDSNYFATSSNLSNHENADNPHGIDASHINGNGSIDGQLLFDGGNSRITCHDGSGNFNIKSGVDNNNRIVEVGGGSHIKMDENGGISLLVSTQPVGNLFTSDTELIIGQTGIRWNGNLLATIQDLNNIDAVKTSDYSNNFNGTGHVKLPNGLYLMWGRTKTFFGDTTGNTIVFPTSFPTQCLQVVTGNSSTNAPADTFAGIYNITNSSFQLAINNGSGAAFNWMAIGY
ncbi:gp53-like domain-containing protein [Orenia marismortui]|uniref:gp53-like domain-containing protein n=1 Tax=Orenia marismortui TaxID=46469 RepID=UPI00037C6DF8|nr:hypothetical protein [Orenia marismortui]